MKIMKKRISKLLMAFAITSLCLFIGGCKADNKSALTIKEGVLLWDEVKSATCYLVDLNDARIECDKAELNLAEVCEYEGDYTITVSSVALDDTVKEIGTTEIQTKATAKPKIVMKQDSDGKTIFVWTATDDARGYAYDLHDGYGMQSAKATESGEYQVMFDGANESIITVTAKGKSDGKMIRMNSEATYHFDGTEIFNMANLVNYPFYMTTDGQRLNELVVGTTLKKGNYDLEMTFYAMDVNGRSLSGNGIWGRRISGLKGNHWFCELPIEGWEECEGTLKAANEPVTYIINANVNKYGETILPLNTWNANEMLVVADVRYGGKSVMADSLKEHDPGDDVVFDIEKLDSFLTVYEGTGEWYDAKNPEKFYAVIPTKEADGKYQMQVSYQLMKSDGSALTANGIWGRRISDLNMKEMYWYCEYPLEGQTDGMDMPKPTQTLTSTFSGTVENGKFKILCHNFAKGELLAVSSIKKISGSSAKFDMATLKNYKNVFVSDGSGGRGQTFRVETTKCERGQFELEVSYYAMDKDGYMLSGNGTGGRRIVDEGADEHWLCITAPGEVHQDAVNTVPEPNKVVTKKMLVTLNKKGRFFLDMFDFIEGETIVITDIKYEGTSILAK